MKPPYGRITAIDLDKGEILLADRARRNAGQHPQSSRAEGLEHSAHRPPRDYRSAGHQDAGDRGEAGFFTTPSGARGAMLRAYDKAPARKSARCTCPLRRAARR